MSVAVKEIGSPDGSAGAGCFNDAKSRVIVHDIIRKKDFLPAAPPPVLPPTRSARPPRPTYCV